MKISFAASASCLLVTLVFCSSYMAASQPDSLEKNIAHSGVISADSRFRPVLTIRKTRELIEDCSRTQSLNFCEQDIIIHLSMNDTPVATGFKSIDNSAPRDIKGYIYSMSTTGSLSSRLIEELDEWIARNLATAASDRYIAVRVPENLQATISPLLYPEEAELYLLFGNGEISASITRSKNYYKGHKYYEKGRYSLRIGPVWAEDIEDFYKNFPDFIIGSEGILTEWWPSGIQHSNLNSISLK